MNLAEVVIDGSRILLPYDELSTVSSLTTTAFNEWQSYNTRALRQIKLVRDLHGRIVPGFLKIVDLDAKDEFEVIIEDFNKDRTTIITEPADVLSQYRSFQLYTLRQIQEYVSTLNLSDSQEEPDHSTFEIINELKLTPCEVVQQAALKVLNCIVFKSTDRKTNVFATNQLFQLFSATPFADVAIAVLSCLENISKKLVHLLGDHDLSASLAIHDSLSRFPDKRESIMELADKIKENLKLTPSRCTTSTCAVSIPSEENIKSTSSSDVKTTHVIGNFHPDADYHNSLTISNLTRLLTFVNSEDQSLSHFGLQKLEKRLEMRSHDVPPQEKIRPYEPVEEQHGHNKVVSQNVQENISHSSAEKQFPSLLASELDAITRSLFKSLKDCLDSKAAGLKSKVSREQHQQQLHKQHQQRAYSVEQSAHSNNSMAAMLIRAALGSPKTDIESVHQIMRCMKLLKAHGRHFSEDKHVRPTDYVASSSASRSTDSVIPSYVTSQIVGGPEVHSPFNEIRPNPDPGKVDQASSSNIDTMQTQTPHYPHDLYYCDIVLSASVQWLRLLATLSNANDEHIAETSAEWLKQAIASVGRGMRSALVRPALDADDIEGDECRGWQVLRVKIEPASVLAFLKPASGGGEGKNRMLLALSYLIFLSEPSAGLSYGINAASSGGGNSNGGGGAVDVGSSSSARFGRVRRRSSEEQALSSSSSSGDRYTNHRVEQQRKQQQHETKTSLSHESVAVEASSGQEASSLARFEDAVLHGEGEVLLRLLLISTAVSSDAIAGQKKHKHNHLHHFMHRNHHHYLHENGSEGGSPTKFHRYHSHPAAAADDDDIHDDECHRFEAGELFDPTRQSHGGSHAWNGSGNSGPIAWAYRIQALQIMARAGALPLCRDVLLRAEAINRLLLLLESAGFESIHDRHLEGKIFNAPNISFFPTDAANDSEEDGEQRQSRPQSLVACRQLLQLVRLGLKILMSLTASSSASVRQVTAAALRTCAFSPLLIPVRRQQQQTEHAQIAGSNTELHGGEVDVTEAVEGTAKLLHHHEHKSYTTLAEIAKFDELIQFYMSMIELES